MRDIIIASAVILLLAAITSEVRRRRWLRDVARRAFHDTAAYLDERKGRRD